MAGRLIRCITGICSWPRRRAKSWAWRGFISSSPPNRRSNPVRLPLPPPSACACSAWLLAGEVACEVDDSEIRRGGISYSIDTVRLYRKDFPEAELFWLIGADQAGQLSLWREASELARLAEFVVIPRPGERAPEVAAPFRGHALRGHPDGHFLLGNTGTLPRRIARHAPDPAGGGGGDTE